MIEYQAAAKINLALRVTGRRDDGYHCLDTLVTFTEFGDVIRVEQANDISLKVEGPFVEELSNNRDNLVLKAARLLEQAARDRGINVPGASIYLNKQLPIASGIGGGSADAAAVLKALCDLWRINPVSVDLKEIALQLGADVPMCLYSKPLTATGIGEKIEPVALAELNIVLINSGVHISTPDIFNALARTGSPALPPVGFQYSNDELLDWLQNTENDLQAPAIGLAPEIQTVLNTLMETDMCQFARMSGSGATCFGLYSSFEQAKSAANDIGQRNPDWWCVASKTIST